MASVAERRTPAHLWIVGILALLWNGFGSFDYFMTRTEGAQYIESMMPGSDTGAIMNYINGFPAYVSIGWALGVWAGLAGAVLLLMRMRLAVPVFALSLIGAVVGLGWQLLNPIPLAEAHEGFNAIVPYLIIAIAAFLLWYSWTLQKKGVLR